MKKLLIIFLMIFCVFDKDLYAECPANGTAYYIGKGYDTSDASNLKKWYNDATVYKQSMGAHRVAEGDDICIGLITRSGQTCELGSTVYSAEASDEWGNTFLVAVETTVGGARFCPTTVTAGNRDNCNLIWTDYFVNESESKCFWLCREGYGGPKCEIDYTNYSSGVCDNTKINKNSYDEIGPVSTRKKENLGDMFKTVSMFDSGWNSVTSGGTMSYQHDIIFVVVGVLENGRGAWLRPYVVRTWADDWQTINSSAFVYPAMKTSSGGGDVKKVLGCKIGYKPNDSTNPTNCIPVNSSLCGEEDPTSGGGNGGGTGTCPNLNWCPGWKAQDGINFYTKYPQNGGPERFCDVTKYKLVDDTNADGTTCKRIDCANGMNLMWEDNYTCTRCVESAQRGLCTKDSKCKWCSVGKCFNRDTCNCDECSNVVTDQDMLYGPTQSDKCWAILDNNEFKACVTGNITE